MRKPQWYHYGFGLMDMFPKRRDGKTTLCGKTANGVYITREKNIVTCPRCVDALREDDWYCPEHGFLPPEDVTFEERCDYCGEVVG